MRWGRSMFEMAASYYFVSKSTAHNGFGYYEFTLSKPALHQSMVTQEIIPLIQADLKEQHGRDYTVIILSIMKFPI